jgi:hypothetical protein
MRSGSSLRGLLRTLAAGLFVALAAPSLLYAAGDPPPRPAPIGDTIAEGTQLVAIGDLTLQRAAIVKGTRVNVTKLSYRRGLLSSVDLELPDGYVVRRVAIGTVRVFFRVAPESTTEPSR